MPRITSLLPDSNFRPQRWEHVSGVTLADPSYYRAGRIDLVLGADVFAQILLTGVRLGPPNSPIAQQTRLGWILSGKVSNQEPSRINVTAFHATSTIESLMERFLSNESIDSDCSNTRTTEEEWCEQHFLDTHRRDDTGRFNVRLPFRFNFDASIGALGRSRNIAVQGLLHLERRFAQNPKLKEEYSKAINEYSTVYALLHAASEIRRDIPQWTF